ncbi:lantibiotic dehydratase [Acrocarpospora catenulata]|uniref:lantibiotic dehydratase n=1 Tax=Acrocarpospora catenulata TaxID=2836182 RepID=UPI001BD9CBE3|nr:lantibiotic dehydratase [Acrocarpospora catenulata]
MPAQRPRRWYVPVDAALFRATATIPSAPAWPTRDDSDAWCAWLAQVWADDSLARAVAIASPGLAADIAKTVAGWRPRPRQARRLVMTLARYLLRMRGRATPFGLFAGVAPLAFAERPSAEWRPQDHVVHTRAGGVWLARIIAQLEADPKIRACLPVVLNDLAEERGDRLVVTGQPHASPPSQSEAQVSVRLIAPMRMICQQARSPITVADLAIRVADEFDVAVSDADAMLASLISAGVLVTSLRPSLTCLDVLAHVLLQLHATGAADSCKRLVAELEDIHADLGRGAGVDEQMRRVAEAEHPQVVDLRLGCDVVLPDAAAEEAAASLSALVRLSPHPDGHPGWRSYHGRFLERYGVGAIVPVADLVNEVTGLGFPDHYTDTEQDLPERLSPRDAALLALAQQAALDRNDEVRIDDEFINGLRPGIVEELQVPPHLEMFAEVWASSMDSLAAGDFRLVVSGVSRGGLCLAGRFTGLFPEAEQHRRIGTYRRLPVAVAGAVTAQLSYPPCHPHLENVTRTPRLLPALISVGEHHRLDGLTVQDLAVTADKAGMYVVSLPERQLVEPFVANASARHTMPPIVRLLSETPRARVVASSPFAWGAARCLPFLPRVVYGRTVLARARWRVPAADLPARDVSPARWHELFSELRERRRLPKMVSVGDSDLRLRLDLDEPMDLQVLRDYLDHAAAGGQAVTVLEASTPETHGWLDGRAHEVVIPVASTRPPTPTPNLFARPMTRPERPVLPGGRLVYAKLYTHPDAMDLILTAHLPRLLEDLTPTTPWWFIRYRDPRPHLRLRLHDVGPEGIARLHTWAEQLRHSRLTGDLVLDTHYPETARYGDGPAQSAAEKLFAADSAAVLEQLRTSGAQSELTGAGTVHLVAGVAGGLQAGLRWLIDHGDIGAAKAAPREVIHAAADLTLAPDRLAKTWAARSEAAAAYRHEMDSAGLYQVAVIRSLVHMNHIRVHGIDRDCERGCYRLARAIALTLTNRGSS